MNANHGKTANQKFSEKKMYISNQKNGTFEEGEATQLSQYQTLIMWKRPLSFESGLIINLKKNERYFHAKTRRARRAELCIFVPL